MSDKKDSLEINVADASTVEPVLYTGKGDAFVAAVGGNNADATYQEAHGAPVESTSPLGYHVGHVTTLFLNVSMIIGTGIFSTPSTILSACGSVGLSLMYWFIGFVLSLAGLSVYLELASYFPSRSGSEVVYLEQAYPHPRYFFPVAFAVQTVILSFNSGNALVLAQYIFKISNRAGEPWEQKGVAIAALTVICLLIIANTRASLWTVNVLGVIKLATLLMITIAGFVVLGGHTKIKDPKANFRNAFEGTNNDAYLLSTALISALFSYSGYANAFNVVNEIKNPIRTIKRSGTASLVIVAVLYMLVNIAYLAAVPKDQIKKSVQTTASLFFQNVFGTKAAHGLTILPVLSAAGNILAVIIGQSRMIREIGRQGVLPWPQFWTSTKPFGTPLAPVAVIWFVSVLMVIIPPAGDAFNFLMSLHNYPDSVFLLLMAVGVFIIRRQRKRLNLPPPAYRSWSWVVLLFVLSKVYLLVMPWVPPKGGVNKSAFHFFYAASSLTALGIIALSGVYYVFWVKLLPKWGNYSIRQTVVALEDGSVTNKLVKIPNDEVAEWDAKHDTSPTSPAQSVSLAGEEQAWPRV